MEKLQTDAKSKEETQQIIDEAQKIGDQLMSFERRKRNSEAQRTIFNFQQSLLDITDLLSVLEEEISQPALLNDPAPDPVSDNEKNQQNKKRIFTKSTVTNEDRHNCPYCEWSCENFKSLQRHCRKKHEDKPKLSSRDNAQQPNYVICLLGKRNHPNVQCNKEVVKNRICQHLSSVHGVFCPPKKEFRGFVRKEDGEAVTAWDVCWLGATDDDPPEEEIIEVPEEEDDTETPKREDDLHREQAAEEEDDTEGPEFVQVADDLPQEQVAEEEDGTEGLGLAVDDTPRVLEDENLEKTSDGNGGIGLVELKENRPGSEVNIHEAEIIISGSPVNEMNQGDCDMPVLQLSDVEQVLGQDGLFSEGDLWVNTDLVEDDVGIESITENEAFLSFPSVDVGDKKLSQTLEVGREPVTINIAKYQNNNQLPESHDSIKTVYELQTIKTDTVITVDNEDCYQIVDHEETIMSSSSECVSQNIISQSGSENSQEEVIINSSFGIIGKHSDSEFDDSEDSVYIAGATTNVLSQAEHGASLPRDSDLNKGFDLLPSVPVPLKVQVFNKKIRKGTTWVSEEYADRYVKKAKIVEEDVSSSIETQGDLVSKEEVVESQNTDEKMAVDDLDEAEYQDIPEDSDESESEDEADTDQSDDEEEIICERWERRNQVKPVTKLNSVPENDNFISKFKHWWQTAGASVETKNKDTSTLRMTLRYLFESPDCFINYQTSENPTFNLSRLVNFGSEDFLAVPSPVSWITEVGGKNGQDFPSRRKEMLKSHQRLRSFINFTLNEYSFEGCAIQQKDAVAKHLKEIEKQVKKGNLFAQLEKLYQSQTRKKAKMMKIIKPLEEENLKHCVRNWFASKESEELENEALTIYKNAMSNQNIKKSDFDRFSKICFFEAALFDKSRIGMWEHLKNEDYAAKRSAWLPPDMDELDYSRLPKEWLLYSEPYPGAPPSSYEIEIISGERSKNHEDHSVVLSPRVNELIEKMIDLKQLIIPEVKLEDYLFVSHSGKKLPKLQNYNGSGSLLFQFGQTCGIEKFTFKMFRKNMEGVIQSSSTLKLNTKELNSHSQKVGQQVYDQLKGSRRNVFLTNLSKQEGGCNLLRNDEKLKETDVVRRELREKTMKDELVSKAKTFLSELKNKAPPDLRPTAVKAEDIEFLQTIFRGTEVGRCIYFFVYQILTSLNAS